MGLDTYAAPEVGTELTRVQLCAFNEADINLCGGMMSSCGNGGSFRGKIYNDVVEEITGESLYQEWIPPDRVVKMAKALEDRVLDLVFGLDIQGANPEDQRQEAESLVRFFQVCSRYHLGLIGWW